jgi:hypothetical protein
VRFAVGLDRNETAFLVYPVRKDPSPESFIPSGLKIFS